MPVIPPENTSRPLHNRSARHNRHERTGAVGKIVTVYQPVPTRTGRWIPWQFGALRNELGRGAKCAFPAFLVVALSSSRSSSRRILLLGLLDALLGRLGLGRTLRGGLLRYLLRGLLGSCHFRGSYAGTQLASMCSSRAPAGEETDAACPANTRQSAPRAEATERLVVTVARQSTPSDRAIIIGHHDRSFTSRAALNRFQAVFVKLNSQSSLDITTHCAARRCNP